MAFPPAYRAWVNEHGLSSSHREKVRVAAVKRALTQYPKVSINGVIYPNMVKAAEAVNKSPRWVGNRARDKRPEWDFIFFVESDNGTE